jgi:hypothetical protein
MKNYWLNKILITPIAMLLTFITIIMTAGMISILFGIKFYDVTHSSPFIIVGFVGGILLFIMYCIFLDEYFEQIKQ